MTDLAAQIVALVEARRGITTRELLLALRRRRADVLRALTELDREPLLYSTRVKGGGRAWHPFPGSRRMSQRPPVAEPGDGSDTDSDGAPR